MWINKQSFDIAGGLHVGTDDLDVGACDQGMILGYASDETGKTEMRTLTVGLDTTGKTTILVKLKLSETMTTIATICFNLETVDYKNFIFIVWAWTSSALCGMITARIRTDWST